MSFVFRSGVMNSGKSAHLLLTHHNFISQGKNVLLFKPSTDTRDGAFVVSRAFNQSLPVNVVSDEPLNSMYRMCQELKPDCVLVDEVQFFAEHRIDELAHIADDLGIMVVCYGLRTDFKTNLFTGSKRLIELGASIEELHATCPHCHNYAVYNMRLSDGVPVFDGEQIQTGGNESYRSVCRQCYEKAKTEVIFKGLDVLERELS